MENIFHPFPDMRFRNPDQNAETRILLDAQAVGLVGPSWEFSAYANMQHLKTVAPYVWPVTSNPKQWRFNGKTGVSVVMFVRNADGTIATVPYSEGMSQLPNSEFWQFVNEYGPSHFARLPMLVTRYFDAEGAADFTFGPGPGVDYPISRTTAWPKDIGVRVTDEGKLEWFRISEYRKMYPITVQQTIPSPVATPAWMVIAAARTIINQTGVDDDTKLAALKAVVNGSSGVQSVPWQQQTPASAI